MVQHALDEAERPICPFGVFAEAAEPSGAQDVVQVTEGRQGGHEFDAESGAMVVEFGDLLRGERVVAQPRLARVVEVDDVLHVELKLVEPVQAERVRESHECAEGGDASARDVVGQGADRHVRMVVDGHGGQRVAVPADELAQDLYAAAQAGHVRAGDVDAVRADGDVTGVDAVRADGRVDVERDARRTAASGADRPAPAGRGEQFVAQLSRGDEAGVAVGRVRVGHDGDGVRSVRRECAVMADEQFRVRDERRLGCRARCDSVHVDSFAYARAMRRGAHDG